MNNKKRISDFLSFLNQKEGRRIPFTVRLKYFSNTITQQEIDELGEDKVYDILQYAEGRDIYHYGQIFGDEKINKLTETSCYMLLLNSVSTGDFYIMCQVLGRKKLNQINPRGIYYLLQRHNVITVAQAFGKENLMRLTKAQISDLIHNQASRNSTYEKLFKDYGII